MKFFKESALRLAELGYLPIPITPGTKKPAAIDNWVQLASTGENLRNWITDYPSHGIGVSTENCVAVDIDVSDARVSRKLTEWCIENIGAAPVRVGRKPRSMLIYRVATPMYKRVSDAYNDGFEDQRIEVLGKGQQFVAYAIHPTTKQPYVWQQHDELLKKYSGVGVLNMELLKIPLEELTVITNDQIEALFDYFESLVNTSCKEWELQHERNIARVVGEYSSDDVFGYDVQPIDITSRELVSALEFIDPDDRDQWRNVGFGIWHQYSGADEGFEIWDTWSKASEKYQFHVMRSQWRSFDHSFRRSEPITARTIMRMAGEAREVEAEITREEQITRLSFAQNRNDVYAIIEELKGTANVPESTLDAICAAHLRVGAGKISRTEAKRKLVMFARQTDLPECLEDWVYEHTNNVFAHADLGMRVVPDVFNRVMGRSLDNKIVYQHGSETLKLPADIAVKFFDLPVVSALIYAPHEPKLFTFLGRNVANTFSSRSVPAAIEPISIRQKKAVARVIAHIEHLLPDPREQRLFTSWLAYIVQNMGKPPKWAVLLNGVPGDGKSFFMHLMSAVLGASNTTTITGQTLESDFNGWATGYSFCCIEEVRVHGTERWRLLDKMKTIITNTTVDINPKGVKPYQALNTTAYYCTSNYDDAVPIDDNDRRYMILKSKWQKASALQSFREANPHYYVNLYSAVTECSPALRYWLLNYKLDMEFDPLANAPSTRARTEMIADTKATELVMLQDAIESDKHQMVSEVFATAAAMRDVMMLTDKRDYVKANYHMRDAGFVKVFEGHLFGGEKHRVYSKVFTMDDMKTKYEIEAFFASRITKNNEFEPIEDEEL